ncbi:DUF4822 domain-containing protein [Microbacterium sp. A204]|uniref:DUF4822 domain-containing protein n=1 Tax=Microbacterium sp. A204 TaxID=3457321 RepID=UPI003FD0D600
MQNRIAPSRGTMIVASVVTAVAIGLVPAGGAFAAETTAVPVSVSAAASTTSPSDVLSGTPWETTGAVDQDGNVVPLTDEAVVNFVGWAYYGTDGTFTMYDLADAPKMQGDWTVSADGAERTLVAKDAAGEVLFERTVPITVLTADEFTYRVIPDAADPATFYDIIHTPTDHPEPLAEAPVDEEVVTIAPDGDAADGEASDELAETGNAGPIVALVAGIVALLGGAAVYITRMVRRGRTS